MDGREKENRLRGQRVGRLTIIGTGGEGDGEIGGEGGGDTGRVERGRVERGKRGWQADHYRERGRRREI